MQALNREEQIDQLFANQPPFRKKQIEKALFDEKIKNWKQVTTLPKEMTEILEKEIPFFSVQIKTIVASHDKETYKAIVSVPEEKEIETVLMKNRRGYWTICVSSQVGCAMRCTFCATGKMGLIRSLSCDEIVDQYRLWQGFLVEHPELSQQISNIVYMGMGEPLANYEEVKKSLRLLLTYTDIGNTHITVSTVGVLPRLEQVLIDPEWPHIRMAISLHSADKETRKEIVPTSYEDFLPKLADWCRRYLERFGNRRHHLTFEYVMLAGVNDTPHHAQVLADFVNTIGNVRVNLIPYNFTECGFACSSLETIQAFMHALEEKSVTVTKRKTQGEDIAAACGQLIKKK